MSKDLILKKIDNLIGIRGSLWTAIIVLNGGIAGLILALSNFSLDIATYIKLTLMFLGGLLDYLIINSIAIANNDIAKLFTQLEKENKK